MDSYLAGDFLFLSATTAPDPDDVAYDPEQDPEVVRAHEKHLATGENHWFSCPLCDDEDPEG